jgi:hypothetical protein
LPLPAQAIIAADANERRPWWRRQALMLFADVAAILSYCG